MFVTVQETSGDLSATDVKLVFEDKAAIPGFNTTDSAPISVVKIVSGVPTIDWLLIGASGGTLALEDQEVLGDVNPTDGELKIEKTDLGEALAVPSVQLPYTQFEVDGQPYTLIQLFGAIMPPPAP